MKNALMPTPFLADQTPQKILILNQAFYPDVASTAQHAADLAAALASRGHEVTAVSSTRCYDNPERRYSANETWKNVSIKRIWSSGFGKRARWRRALDFGTFLTSCVWKIATLPRQDVVITMTSPPLISFLGALLVSIRGGRLIFWVMDLNPDEAIAAGWLKPDSIPSRVLQKLLDFSIRTADGIIALDRFMAVRLRDKGATPQSLAVLPPWSHSDAVFFDHSGRADFRRAHGLEDKFVVMYSGNHSPCHPLETILHAARQLRDDPNLAFVFIGGGSEFKTVKNFAASEKLSNIVCLPYQPIEKLSASLSSADLHCVVMGDPFVGMIHPCKIYNILSLGTPVLYVGPEDSHIGDIGRQTNAGWFHAVRHGEADLAVAKIRTAAAAALLQVDAEIQISTSYAQAELVDSHIAVVEKKRRHSRTSNAPATGPSWPSAINNNPQMEKNTNE